MILDFLPIIAGFTVIVLAAKEIGRGVQFVGLPLISGFIFAGILAGPYLLGFFKADIVPYFRFVDAVALPFIAFAAGGELRLEELKRRLKSILTITLMIVVVVNCAGALAILLLADWLPFMHGLSSLERIGAAVLGGTILVAVSPSSAIAVIKEVRAKGVFTQTVLGVTVLMDAVVILLFAVSESFAHSFSKGAGFSFGLIVKLLIEIALDIATGVCAALMIKGVLWTNLQIAYKTALLLAVGYSVFSFSAFLQGAASAHGPVSFFSEPLLICMVAGFFISNFTVYRSEFLKIIEGAAPVIFVLFFTSVGAGLDIDVLTASWASALIVIAVRISGMYIGAWAGGAIAGNPRRENRLIGIAFITQAGISLSLAKEAAVAFPGWGAEFASFIIGIIVANTILGPAFFKGALHLSGEAHPKADPGEFDDPHSVIIFGVESQSIALARQLGLQGWHVKLADVDETRTAVLKESAVEVVLLPDLAPQSLKKIGMDKSWTVVAMLDDDANFKICEAAYEHFGTVHVIVRAVGDDVARFYEVGATVLDPASAMVNLLNHYVRSRSAASLLLGQETGKDVVEIVIGNHSLHGVALRDLKLPSDVLVLSVRRKGQLLLSHGYTRLRLGDEVTVVGTLESLEQVQVRFEG